MNNNHGFPTIEDWNKVNIPAYGCINCGFSHYNFFKVFDEKTSKCKNCGFKVKEGD